MTPTSDDRCPPREGRRRQFRLRSLMMAVAVAAAWLASLRVPGVGTFALILVGALSVGLAALLGAMALGWLGFGLFALFDRLARPGGDRDPEPKPRPVDDWWT
jgi:hypothetical protein